MTPFHLETPRGDCFALLHEPPLGARRSGALLHVPAFAEEMNRSRRAVAQAARRFAAAGWTVLQFDPSGCGDSAGEFGDASWEDWRADVLAAAAWLRRHRHLPLWLWGLRAGCLLAAEAAPGIDGLGGMLLWQPVLMGEQHLMHFLRFKVAQAMLADAQGREHTDALRSRLWSGEGVEVAGYAVSARLAEGLSSARLQPAPGCPRVVWLETTTGADATLSPAASRAVQSWRDAAVRVDAASVTAPPFWQTPETCECPALIEHSLALLEAD